MTTRRSMSRSATDVLILAVLVVFPSRAIHATPSFEGGYASFAGGRDSIVVADMNEDGSNDIVTGATGTGYGLYLYTSDGALPDPGFSLATLYSASTPSVAVADVVGTTRPDIVASSGGVQVWRNDGPGSFTRYLLSSAAAVSVFPVGKGPATVYYAAGTALGYVVFTNPSFPADYPIVSGAAADTYRSVFVGDIDGDAYPDVLTAGATGLRWNEPAEPAGELLISNLDCYDAEIGDVDGDSLTDVVMATPTEIRWLERVPPRPPFGWRWITNVIATGEAFRDVHLVDLDQDGDTDVLIADREVVDGPTDPYDGRVMWLDNDGASPTPSFTARTIAHSSRFDSVSAARVVTDGDVNGDGALDVVHGWSSTISPKLTWLEVSENAYDLWRLDGTALEGLGVAVAGGTDINRDGFPDALVANRCRTGACTNRVALYLGTATGLEATPAWTATGAQAAEEFGASVAFVGDVNGDTYVDVAVGAPRYKQLSSCSSPPGDRVGRVYLWYGGPADGGNRSGLGSAGRPSNADKILELPYENHRCYSPPDAIRDPGFGAAVISAGDADGDGRSDLMIGDPGHVFGNCYPNSTRGFGRVFLYRGSAQGPTAAGSLTLNACSCSNQSACTEEFFGTHLAAGQFNNGDIPDLIVSAPGREESHVYYDLAWPTDEPWDHNGDIVFNRASGGVTVADVDHDGYDDLVVGGTTSAAAYLGSSAGLVATSWTYGAPGSITAVSRAGDLDGDCRDEIALADSTRVGLFYGESSAQGLGLVPELEILPEWPALAPAGDVGWDGWEELLVGDDLSTSGGAVAVYHDYRTIPPPPDCDLDGARRDVDCGDRDASVYPGASELCDYQDNDCDFTVDEGFSLYGSCAAGLGICRRTGETLCSVDGLSTVCSAVPGVPTAELCDGLDNDCDGPVDENWPALGNPCSAGLGVCTASGTIVCTGDGSGAVCDAVPGTPSAELCDGLDNDCDGPVDETWPTLGNPCSAGLGVCHASGTIVCTGDGSGSVCSAVPGTPSPELCDGLDNDCDGPVDETWPTLGDPCSAGVGACYAIGQIVCTGDGSGSTCSADPGTPSSEICDGLDNDCDGPVDEDAIDAVTWYRDSDGDSFGDPNDVLVSCGTPSGYVTNGDDCDDTDPGMGTCNTPTSPDPVTFDDPNGAATVTLPNVTSPGDTSVSSAPCSAPPEGLFLTRNPVCVDIQTTASFSGDAEVCISYDDTDMTAVQEQQLVMVRCPEGGPCEPLVTSSHDMDANVLCALTAEFSDFMVGTLTDVDNDFVPDLVDNCPHELNFFQEDSGGLDSADPDGIGDVCQCGDVTNDGIVQINDATIIKRAILGLGPGIGAPGKCNVIGTTDPAISNPALAVTVDCEINDATVIKRAILGLGPGIQSVCGPAVGVSP